MATVTQVHIQDPTVDLNHKLRVTAVCTDTVGIKGVIARFNDVCVQMEKGPGNVYRRAIPSFRLGTYNGTPTVWAMGGNATTPEIGVARADKSVTVSQPDAIIPEEFLKTLFEDGLDYTWRGNEPQVIVTYDERRIDRLNEFGIIIKPNKAIRENTTRMHTKNVHYPITLYIIHPDSYQACKEFFDHIVNVEEENINLVNSNRYDWLEPKDEGLRIPARNVYKIRHDLVLHIDVQETNIPDV